MRVRECAKTCCTTTVDIRRPHQWSGGDGRRHLSVSGGNADQRVEEKRNDDDDKERARSVERAANRVVAMTGLAIGNAHHTYSRLL